MNIIKGNNVKIVGQGQRLMIFAHGYGCSQNMWRYVAPAFEKDFRVVLFDHVGAGASDTSAYDRTKYSSLHGYADDIISICKALDGKDVVFVGHSVAAMMGALAAIKEPALFSRLILVGPSPCYINDGAYQGGFDAATMQGLLNSLEANFEDWAKAMAPVIMGNSSQPALGQELAQSFCSTKPEIAKDFARVTFLSDLREDMKRVRVPALILQCAEDAIAPETVGRYLHQELATSTLTFLKATGHCPHLSAPDETVAAIRGFLGLRLANAS